ncbi:hypothetical protein CJ307_35400, partial [Klebsiella quasipneumoniae]
SSVRGALQAVCLPKHGATGEIKIGIRTAKRTPGKTWRSLSSSVRGALQAVCLPKHGATGEIKIGIRTAKRTPG